MSKHVANVPVNFVATVKLVPAICSMIITTIKEKKAAFAEQVNNEIEHRKTAVQNVSI